MQDVAIVGDWDAYPALGPTLRARQFREALTAAGLTTCRIGFRSTSGPLEPPTFRFADVDNHISLGPRLPANYRAIVGASTYPSFAAAVSIPTDVPLWVDLFGDPIAEATARLARTGEDAAVDTARFLLEHAIGRANAVSVVSHRQRLVARSQACLLWPRRAQSLPVFVVPCALPTQPRRSSQRDSARTRMLLSGSANCWLDIETLKGALSLVLGRLPHLEIHSTGGAIQGYDDVTAVSLGSLFATLRIDHCIREYGWLPPDELERVTSEVDFAVLPEAPLLERELGSANRILDWISRGVPVICSDQTELAADLSLVGGVLTYKAADPAALANQIVRLATSAKLRADTAEAASAWARISASPEQTGRPLVAWAASRPTRPGLSTAASRGHAVTRLASQASGSPSLPTHPSSLARRVLRLARRSIHLATAVRTAPLRPLRRLGTTVLGISSGARSIVLDLGRAAVLHCSHLATTLRKNTSWGAWRKPVLPTFVGVSELRVLVATPYPVLPAISGGGVRVSGLLGALAANAQVTVVALNRGRNDPRQLAALSDLLQGGAAYMVHHQPGTLEGRDLLPPSARAQLSAEFPFVLNDLVAAHAANVVQLEFTEMGQYLSRLARGPVSVLVEHDICHVTAARRRTEGFHTRFLGDRRLWGKTLDLLRLERFEIANVKRADVVHAMSTTDAGLLWKLSRHARIWDVPNSVALPNAQRARPKRDANLALFIGYFGHSPNRDGALWFLEAIWPIVRAAIPDARIAIVGGMAPHELTVLAGKDGIEFCGVVPSITPWLDRSTVMVAPIRAGSGTRLKLLDAFAHEVPCVATALAVEGLDARDREHLLVRNDAPSFAAAIIEIMKDRELADGLGNAAKALVQSRFTWTAAAQRAIGSYLSAPREKGTQIERPTAVIDPIRSTPPRVSIILPTYRGGPRLLAVLDAIADQRGAESFEVICVDSGSDDADLQQMRVRGARVVRIPNEAFDHGLARDLGARVARGEVFVFLNQDALPASPFWLALLTEPLLRPGRFEAIQGGIREVPDRHGRFFWDSGGGRFYYTRETTRWMEEFGGLGFSTVNCALRRRAWEALPFGFAPIMEDKKWQMRAASRGFRIGQRHGADVQHSHDWSTASLWRRCRAEGEGWTFLGRPYEFGDAVHDLVHRATWRSWLRALVSGNLRSAAEVSFPLVRPLALWRGSRRGAAEAHRPTIRYAPAIVESEA